MLRAVCRTHIFQWKNHLFNELFKFHIIFVIISRFFNEHCPAIDSVVLVVSPARV